MSLQNQIETQQRMIKTDSYSMSIGEVVNLYRDKEIDIHPAFQRIYRWTEKQKTNLIESILLGIPLPAIFVFQRQDGIWDVIDGIQRISTILQFLGELKDEDDAQIPPLVLEKAHYLPALENKVWEQWSSTNNLDHVFTPEQRILIKRAKLSFNILQPGSDEQTKYELFQRLNRGGSLLSDQEMRNCILVMLNKQFYDWLKELSSREYFLRCLALTDRAISEAYEMELALRFLIFKKIEPNRLVNIGDLTEFLTEQMSNLAATGGFNEEEESNIFEYVFSTLADALESDSFRRFDSIKQKFLGGFSVSAFETIAMGLGFHWPNAETYITEEFLVTQAKSIWNDEEFTGSSGSGVRASTRIPKTIAYGRRIFSNA
jgi:uncharacterized protein with ParB-like and HNH nuclease domain